MNTESPAAAPWSPQQSTMAWALARPDMTAGLLAEYVEFFIDYLANKEGKPYKDRDAAFRNCIRGDWGGLLRRAKPFGNRNEQSVRW